MSNRSYLAVSDTESIYPSFVQKDYDATNQLIATVAEAVPLLWLAMFRERDLRRTVFTADGEQVPAFAPICPKDRAMEQLEQAISYLSTLYPKFGRLAEYASMFRSALEPLPYRFVSIELEEIAGLYPTEHRFEELLTLGLRGFDTPDGIEFHCEDVTIDISGIQISFEPMDDEEMDEDLMEELKELNSGGPMTNTGTITIEGFSAQSHAQVLERLTSIKPNVPLPSVRMYLDDLEHSEDESWNFANVLGVGRHGSMGYGREVPWEKEDADFGWEVIPADDDDA